MSGVQDYKQLAQEKRLAELKKRQQYLKSLPTPATLQSPVKKSQEKKTAVTPNSRTGKSKMKCFLCDQLGHFANECKAKPAESGGRGNPRKKFHDTKQVTTQEQTTQPRQWR